MPGTTDTGNHGDDQVTTVALPFSYSLYDQTFNGINLSSNGNAQFTTTDTAYTNVCPLPWTTHNYTIFPYWDDLYRIIMLARLRGLSQRTVRNLHLGNRQCAQPYLQHRMARPLLPGTGRPANHELTSVRGADPLRCDLRHGGSGQQQRHCGSAEERHRL